MLILLTILLTVRLQAQDQQIIFYPIDVEGDSYGGAGTNWILHRADTASFVLFGEQHGVAGVAEFVDFIYQELASVGFNHLALETDGWTTQGSADLGVLAFTKKNPHSIAFDTDGDLQLMQTAIDLKHPIWGMDQMQTAIHPFKRLTEIATTAKQRRLARGAFFKSVVKAGSYSREDHMADLLVLEEAFASNTSEEKDRILKELKRTLKIFTLWMDETTRQTSVEMREELMKSNFDSYLGLYPEAKVIFKMGGAHTMYGIGPNGVPTLGDHVSQVASKDNKRMLSISLRRFNEETSLVSKEAFGEHSMVLIDTEAAVLQDMEGSTDPSFSRFDAIIYLKDAGYASKRINRLNEANFRTGFISGVIPLAIGLIVCLISLIAGIVAIWRKRKSVTSRAWRFAGLASLLLLLLIGPQVKQLLSYPDSLATVSRGVIPFVLQMGFGLVAVLLAYLTFRLARNERISIAFKIFYAMFVIGYCMVVYFLHYWNLGGMMG